VQRETLIHTLNTCSRHDMAEILLTLNTNQFINQKLISRCL